MSPCLLLTHYDALIHCSDLKKYLVIKFCNGNNIDQNDFETIILSTCLGETSCCVWTGDTIFEMTSGIASAFYLGKIHCDLVSFHRVLGCWMEIY